MEPTRHTYTSQRMELNYWCWGDERNPPLILIHGTRDHARSWDRTAEAFAGRYAVYAPDLRGHGDSQWAVGGNYSIIDYALDIHALGEHLGRESYAVIGHSLGGGVALEYAGAFPEKVTKLVTIEGLGGLGWASNVRRPAHVRMREWVQSMRQLEQRQLRLYPSIESATERMLEANGHLTPALARDLTEQGVRPTSEGYTWKFDNFTHAGSPYEFNMEDARDLWNQIRAPILIIWGEESWGRRFPNGLDLSAFHNYRAVGVPAAAHWVQHDQFDTFVRLVEEFLAS